MKKHIKPLVIAGPCSAETESQVLATAAEIAKDPRVSIYRASLWKPRTEPGCFEGVGEAGLPWLQRVQQEHGLRVCTEVAKASHVEAALKAGVDVIWIGARSTTNPFTVQELADALQGCDIPVMVKNPVSPDVKLWSGAVRRIQKAGIKNITLIHRGFTPYVKSELRNNPIWKIPIQMKERWPELKMVCDPSHIAGNREKLMGICLRAQELNLDGFMIEAHINPSEAWSDAAQQVTPARLSAMLNELGMAQQPPLLSLRQELDCLDQQLWELIAERMDISRRIGDEKQRLGMGVVQEGRWMQVEQKGRQRASKLGLSEEFVHRYLEAIHRESISIQRAAQ